MSFILGLTGSIGMGKSATSAMFRAAGVPVHDADAVVHRLYAGEAVPLLADAFPGVAHEGRIDRQKLSHYVLGDSEAMRRLEAIVHPLVRRERDRFLATARKIGASLVVLDIPLLLETGGERDCDAVVVVTAPAAVQRARVLQRAGMSPERFEAILAKQMPDHEKRRRAHFLVDSSRGFAAAERQVRDILKALAGRHGHVRG